MHISTKPDHSHVVHGTTSLILTTLGRTDTDEKHPKVRQVPSVECSMSVVRATLGRPKPVSDLLLAEPVIVARAANATLGDNHVIGWKAMADDYDVIRNHIARGISTGRRVILINGDDAVDLGFKDRDLIDVIKIFQGEERRADSFRLVAYPTPRGCAADFARLARRRVVG